jgi:lysophospholipase L1-like esterase
MLGGSCEVKNFGYPGTSVTKNQGLSYIGSSYYTNSLAYKADVVIICIGGNDCQQNIWNVGTFEKDYEELIAAYQNQGNDPLVVAMTGGYCELPDGKNQMIWGHSDKLIEEKVQPAQNRAADKLGVPRADLRAVIKPNADAYIDGDDGVHYTAAGYQAMAQLAYDLLMPLVELPADRGALRKALANEITNLADFTKESVAAYQEALAKAKAVMEDAEATQEEIDAAAAALLAAHNGLTVAGMPGDVDEDEEITSTDARLTLQYYAGKITAEDLDLSVADVDGDGAITSTDARLILQKYAGKIEDFPIQTLAEG